MHIKLLATSNFFNFYKTNEGTYANIKLLINMKYA